MIHLDAPMSRGPTYRRRVIVAIVAGALSLLLWSTTAGAAAWVRIQADPGQPSAGATVRIHAQIVDTQGADCLDDPGARVIPNPDAYSGGSGPVLDTMEMHIHAPGTTRTPISLTLTRSEVDAGVWEGSFIFPEPGRWSLQMAYPSWSSGIAGDPGSPAWSTDTCTGAERIIVVLPAKVREPDTGVHCLAQPGNRPDRPGPVS